MNIRQTDDYNFSAFLYSIKYAANKAGLSPTVCVKNTVGLKVLSNKINNGFS